MVEIHPKKLAGNWESGFALDFHTISSEYIGDDENGRPQFTTTRSDIGELLYRLKYKSDRSVLKIITSTVSDFLKLRKWPIDLIISTPPSRARRAFQPVPVVAKGIGKNLGIKVCIDCVAKVKDTPELKEIYDYGKRMNLLQDAFAVNEADIAGHSVLLFDDLYRSGATLNAVSKALVEKGKARKVYVLVITRTRSKR